MSASLRLALGQVEPLVGDKAGNLQRAEALAGQAAEAGADLLILPEMYLTGYALGREQTLALAEPADGPSAQEIAAIAAKHSVAIMYGYPEAATGGTEVFNTAGFVDSTGERLLDYRKLHYFGDLDRDQFDPIPGEITASCCPVIPWRGWQLGVGICYDIEFPELARQLAVSGADLICVPTANMVDCDHVQELLLPARAVENQLYVAYANYCGADSVFEYGGLSQLAAPGGQQTLAGRGEQLLIAELDRQSLEASRAENPYLRDRLFQVAPRGAEMTADFPHSS